MKIAILVSMFPPKWLGGTEIATQNITRHLAQNGHDVYIITSLDRGLQKESQEDNFFVRRVFCPKIKFLGVIYFWLKCLFLLKKVNPQVAHSQTIQMALPCFLAKKLFNIPYIVYCHGSDVYLPWKFKKIISKLVLENAKAVVVLTQNMKKELEGFYIKNIFIIPNGVELSKFENLPKAGVRKELKIDEAENVALFVGSFKAVKGVKYLIEALNIVKEKKIRCRLLLVGSGEEGEELKKLSKKLGLMESINFIGSVKNEEIPKYMTASDIFVLPSLSEGLPVVILEAMASGLPVLATKAGGLPEIIKNGENGFLVEPKNSEQIAEKILYLFFNDDIRKSISLNNKEKAKNYSWDLITEKLVEVYRLCLKKN